MINEVISAIASKISYHIEFMDRCGYTDGYLVESFESCYIFDQCISNGLIPQRKVIYKNISKPRFSEFSLSFYSTDWVDKINCLITPRLFNRNSNELAALCKEIRNIDPSIVFFDQVWSNQAFWTEEEPCIFEFRSIDFVLLNDTVIPSYYANSQYIDILLKTISARNASTMLDLCTGSGCIGLSCYNEHDGIGDVWCCDLSQSAVNSVCQTINTLGSNKKNATSVLSDTFSGIPTGLKFDIISANPPHMNCLAHNIRDIAGADPDWRFHKAFFSGLDSRLTESGVAILIENGRSSYSDTSLFYEMAKNCNRNIELFDSVSIPGTEWYLIYLRKFSN